MSTVNNTDYDTWSIPTETNDERDFNPDPLGITTYYYRAVQSGRCSDTSNIVTVTVLPSITDNSIGESQEVCEDSLFVPLAETATLDGGDGPGTYDTSGRFLMVQSGLLLLVLLIRRDMIPTS